MCRLLSGGFDRVMRTPFLASRRRRRIRRPPLPLPSPPRSRDPGHIGGDLEKAAGGARPRVDHIPAAGGAAVREGVDLGTLVWEVGGASEAVQDLKVGLLVSGTVDGSGWKKRESLGPGRKSGRNASMR